MGAREQFSFIVSLRESFCRILSKGVNYLLLFMESQEGSGKPSQEAIVIVQVRYDGVSF